MYIGGQAQKTVEAGACLEGPYTMSCNENKVNNK